MKARKAFAGFVAGVLFGVVCAALIVAIYTIATL